MRPNNLTVIVAQEHLLNALDPMILRCPLDFLACEITHNKRLAVPDERKDLLAVPVEHLVVAIDKSVEVLLAQAEDSRVEMVRRAGVRDFGLGVDSPCVVRVDRHPRFDVGTGEATVGRGAPLHGRAPVVAGFLLVFLFGDVVGFRVKWFGFAESG